jgi:hypothetical protein
MSKKAESPRSEADHRFAARLLIRQAIAENDRAVKKREMKLGRSLLPREARALRK